MSDIKDQIVQAAKPIFEKYGYKKTTLSDISNAFGKVKTSLYHYFDSKESIYIALLDMEFNCIITEIKKSVNANETTEMQLQQFITARIKASKKNEMINSALNSQNSNHINYASQLLEKIDENNTHTLSKIIEFGIDKGTIKPLNILLVAKSISTAIKGLENHFNNDTALIENRIDELLNILLYGIIDEKNNNA